MKQNWVVTFDCDEYVIRYGTEAEVRASLDPLGCKVLAIRPLDECKLKGMPWMKDGELRCEPES